MSARVIDGKKIASEIRDSVAKRVAALKQQGINPGFAAIIVGDDPASATYVKSIKGKAMREAGIEPFVTELPASTTQAELTKAINSYNEDPHIHGLLVQQPLPGDLDPLIAQGDVLPGKDVDGLNPINAGLLALGRPGFVPCTPLGVKVLLERSGTKVEGAQVVVVGRSNLVGRPLSILLSLKSGGSNGTVTLCHTGTVDLQSFTTDADILVVAAGAPKSITAEMIKPGATVIDVGINSTPGGLVGDVDYEAAAEVAAAITPVPGGVGPMTVAMLLSNTVDAAESTTTYS